MASNMQKVVQEIMKDPKLKKAIEDPVSFSQIILGIEPRWYQKLILKCKSLQKIARMGRRSGKCLYEKSKVMTTEGPIEVKELHKKKDKIPHILTLNQEEIKIETTGDYFVLDNGIKPTYELTTQTGRTNYATGNHPYLTIGKDGKLDWVDIDNLEVGDRIAVPTTYEGLVDGIELGEKEARLLGYLTGDVGTSSHFVTFSNIDQGVIEDFKNIVSEYDAVIKDYSNTDDYRVVGNKYGENQVTDLCRKHKLLGKKSIEKVVPQDILRGTKSDISNFLSAYWDCDGWCSIVSKTYDKAHKIPKIEVGCCSASKELAKGIHHLLLRLGITSLLKEKKVKYQGEYRKAWQVTISDIENIRKFSQELNLKSIKKDKLEEILDLLGKKNPTNNRKLTNIPKTIWPYIKEKQKELFMKNWQVCDDDTGNKTLRLRTQYSVNKEKVSTYANNLDDDYLRNLSSNNIVWDEIVSIEYIGEKQTYDLTVPGTHNFIADDIISHNTFTMILHMLYYAFTNPDSKQLVIGPLGIQVDTIFDELRSIIRKTPLLRDSMTRSVQSPQRIEFGNGAVIIGLSAGSSSGSGAKNMRGQGADYIYLDETDYLNEEDINSIIGVSLNDIGNVGLWCSSTPTGSRELFYEWCMSSKETYCVKSKDNHTPIKKVKKDKKAANKWTQFHFPSWCNPQWNNEMEAELRALFTEQGYIHEVEARFGDETEGVFNKEAVKRALKDYKYSDMRIRKPLPDTTRIIGVDWDKQICPVSCRELLEYPKIA